MSDFSEVHGDSENDKRIEENANYIHTIAELQAQLAEAKGLMTDRQCLDSLDWMGYANQYEIKPDKKGDVADFQDKLLKHLNKRIDAFLAKGGKV